MNQKNYLSKVFPNADKTKIKPEVTHVASGRTSWCKPLAEQVGSLIKS